MGNNASGLPGKGGLPRRGANGGNEYVRGGDM